jgi:hypothetical protein
VALQALSERQQGEQSIQSLKEAVDAYSQALTELAQREDEQWASTQDNLGIALKNLGDRLPRAEISIELGLC